PLVILPFRLENLVEEARSQSVVAGISRVVERMVGGAGDDFADPAIEAYRFQLEIRMAERIDDQVSDIPACYSEEIHREETIHDRQRAEQPDIEDQLLRERERHRGERRVQMALVVLQVNPMERAQMERAMGAVVPDLGGDGRAEQ